MNVGGKHYLGSLDILLIKDLFSDSSINNKIPGMNLFMYSCNPANQDESA